MCRFEVTPDFDFITVVAVIRTRCAIVESGPAAHQSQRIAACGLRARLPAGKTPAADIAQWS
jgi:hypothetical protein